MFSSPKKQAQASRSARGKKIESPNVKRRLSDEYVIRRLEDSCKEMARKRREQRNAEIRSHGSSVDSQRRSIAQEILSDMIQDGFFETENSFTDTEYSEIINYIEEEYDYQYAKMVNDYEQQMEDAANYYGSLVDDIYSLPCPRCYSGSLIEQGPQAVACKQCGFFVSKPMEEMQRLLNGVYQSHPCGKVLSCEVGPNGQLRFSCSNCSFSVIV